MTHPSKHIFYVVKFTLYKIFMLGYAMIVATIWTFSTRSSSKEDAKISSLLLVKAVCLGVASVDLGVTASERNFSLLSACLVHIRSILVIPNVVLARLTFLIRHICTRGRNLFASRTLHPLVNLIFFQFLHPFKFTLFVILALFLFYI